MLVRLQDITAQKERQQKKKVQQQSTRTHDRHSNAEFQLCEPRNKIVTAYVMGSGLIAGPFSPIASPPELRRLAAYNVKSTVN